MRLDVYFSCVEAHNAPLLRPLKLGAIFVARPENGLLAFA